MNPIELLNEYHDKKNVSFEDEMKKLMEYYVNRVYEERAIMDVSLIEELLNYNPFSKLEENSTSPRNNSHYRVGCDPYYEEPTQYQKDYISFKKQIKW